jgi:hypothetical protein
MYRTDTTIRKDIGLDMVTVHVGSDKTPFIVHKDLLTSSSPYFKAAFEGKFREATDNSVPLVDVTPTQFRRFLDWLYFKKLPNGENRDGKCPSCRLPSDECAKKTKLVVPIPSTKKQ